MEGDAHLGLYVKVKFHKLVVNRCIGRHNFALAGGREATAVVCAYSLGA